MRTDLSEEDRKRHIARSAKFEASKPYIHVAGGDVDLRFYVPGRMCAWRVSHLLDKEPETIAWIRGMPQGAVLYDVGANIGLYTLWAAATRGARVYAFEPEASNYAVLNDNLRVNELTATCAAYCLGISDTVGYGLMQVRSNTVGGSGHQVLVTDGLRVVVEEPQGHQGVATATLDHLVYTCGFDCPTHLKIDVDGLEHAVIAGASRLLRDPRLRSIMIELMINEPFHQEVAAALVAAGFAKDEDMERAVREKDVGVKHTGNILFTRPESAAAG